MYLQSSRTRGPSILCPVLLSLLDFPVQISCIHSSQVCFILRGKSNNLSSFWQQYYVTYIISLYAVATEKSRMKIFVWHLMCWNLCGIVVLEIFTSLSVLLGFYCCFIYHCMGTCFRYIVMALGHIQCIFIFPNLLLPFTNRSWHRWRVY